MYNERDSLTPSAWNNPRWVDIPLKSINQKIQILMVYDLVTPKERISLHDSQ